MIISKKIALSIHPSDVDNPQQMSIYKTTMVRKKPVMRSPERYLAIPMYCEEWHQICSSKVGMLQAPLVSRLDIDNVFNGESTCILDYVSHADAGEHDEPLYFMVIVKKGTRTKDGGRVCDYTNKMKVVMIGDESTMCPTQFTPATARTQGVNSQSRMPSNAEVEAADDMMPDFEEDDFSDVSTCRWNESSEGDSHTDGGDSPEARNLRNEFAISGDGRKDRTRETSTFIDGSKYAVNTSKRLDQMTARWRGGEVKAHRHKYTEAVKRLAQMPGGKTMHASRTSKVSKRTLTECIKRAQEWQNWHRRVVQYLVLTGP